MGRESNPPAGTAQQRPQHAGDAKLATADERQPIADGEHAERAVHTLDDGGDATRSEYGGEPDRAESDPASQPAAAGADAHDDAADVAANAEPGGSEHDDEPAGAERDPSDPAGHGAVAAGRAGTRRNDGHPATAARHGATAADRQHAIRAQPTALRRFYAANAERNVEPNQS